MIIDLYKTYLIGIIAFFRRFSGKAGLRFFIIAIFTIIFITTLTLLEVLLRMIIKYGQRRVMDVNQNRFNKQIMEFNLKPGLLETVIA